MGLPSLRGGEAFAPVEEQRGVAVMADFVDEGEYAEVLDVPIVAWNVFVLAHFPHPTKAIHTSTIAPCHALGRWVAVLVAPSSKAIGRPIH